MRYLSIDLEATGLRENDLIIEFAAVPFDSETQKVEKNLSWHRYIECPTFHELRPSLDEWVIKNNQSLIEKAHNEGLPLEKFKKELTTYLTSKEIQEYFKNQIVEKIILFGKSMNAIDLPFLNRDLGWKYMREHFHHQILDLSSVVYQLIDAKKLPEKCSKGSELTAHLGFGEVAHTALEDAIHTAEIYLKLLEEKY